MTKSFCFFFQKEALSFHSFLNKSTQNLLSIEPRISGEILHQTRSSLWRDNMAENSLAKLSRRLAKRARLVLIWL